MTDTANQIRCNNYTAWITVNGEPLPCYGDEVDAKKDLTTCWVPSQIDQAFSVCYLRTLAGEFQYQASVFLDGKKVRTSIHKVSRNKNQPPVAHSIDSMIVSDCERRAFVFSSVELTDDDTYLEHTHADVGEIKIVITKMKVVGTKTVRPSSQSSTSTTASSEVLKPAKVHERAKKGLVHQVKLGDSMPYEAKKHTAPYVKTLRKECGKEATFIFKYRPLGLLQANGIAPPPIHPVIENPEIFEILDDSDVADVKPEVVDADDKEAILSKERALLAELEQVRQAKRAAFSNDDSRSKKKIKSEPSPFLPGEIIDLTL